MKATNTFEVFEDVWPVPLVADDPVIGGGAAAARRPGVIGPRYKARHAAATAGKRATADTHYFANGSGLCAAQNGPGETIALGLLALASAVAVAQAFAPIIELAPNWGLFRVWVAALVCLPA